MENIQDSFAELFEGESNIESMIKEEHDKLTRMYESRSDEQLRKELRYNLNEYKIGDLLIISKELISRDIEASFALLIINTSVTDIYMQSSDEADHYQNGLIAECLSVSMGMTSELYKSGIICFEDLLSMERIIDRHAEQLNMKKFYEKEELQKKYSEFKEFVVEEYVQRTF